ncbi:hypothetical protein ILUMI_00048 [Ignelater luminosus]|uniref:Uncharacterized protein n=1 Tax=Ignelater luminosus TaxID=2038154 RepID=A0A8K0GLM7_IGNLU|nr:hypothetical protein ILUMI_00048 [Ignelater luminosus]
MSSIKFSSDSSQPHKDEERRKLPLIKINYRDLLEDEPPSSKAGKGKKQKCTVTAVSNSLRKVPKPVRVTYNPSEWKDSSLLGKSKSANGSKKLVVPDSGTFAKPKNLTMKTDKSVRKELFGGRGSNTFRRYSNSNQSGFKPRTLNPPKIFVQLDNTQPLIDINDAEMQLYKKLDCFKTFTNKIGYFNEVPNFKNVSFEVNVQEGNTSSPLNTDPKLTESINVLKPTEVNVESPTESEFIKNEKICDVNNPKTESGNKLKSCLSKASDGDLNDAVIKIFQDEHQSFKYISSKFKILEEQFREFQVAMITHQEEHTKNAKKLMEILENSKENLILNKGWHSTKLNGLQDSLPSEPPVRSSKKKSVVFNLNNSTENKQVSENIELNDKGLEKAVNFYNSMRKDYKSILSTPKLDRAVLQSPKSLKKSQTDSISRRLQKQCLLLLDTPSNKNK